MTNNLGSYGRGSPARGIDLYKAASRYLQHRALFPKKPKAAGPRGKHRKNTRKRIPHALSRAFSSNRPINGLITSFNKGGFEVVSHGARAFCPYSMMYPPVITESDKRNLVGQKLEFVIEKIVPRVVLSRRKVVRKYTLVSCNS